MVVVTKDASSDILLKYYLDSEIVGLDEGIYVAREAGAHLFMALSSFKTVKLEDLLTFLPKDKILRYQEENEDKTDEKIIDFLFGQGAEEIVLLDKLGGRFIHVHSLLTQMKKAKGTLILHDSDNYLAYYPEGVHVISKQGYSSFSLFGFPEADISLEHVSKPIKNMHLSFADTPALDNKILERVAVLKVSSGGVLLALTNSDD